MTARRGVLAVDPIGCRAHGLCADLLPELIRLDEWGYPVLPGRPIPEHLLADARRAVASCPALALRLRQVSSPDASPASPVSVPRARAAES
jgi:ferredoxin